MSPMLRILGKAFGWTLGGLAVSIAGAVAGLVSEPGNEWIRQQALDAAAPSFPNGKLVIESVNTNLLGHLELVGVEIHDDSENTLVRLDRLRLDYNLLALLNKE